VNALASIRDARFSFDPAVTPPSVSSMTPSERAVLKQFFGIEAVEPMPESTEVTLLKNLNDEPAIEMSDVPDIQEDAVVEKVPDAAPEPALISGPSSKPYIIGGLILAVLCILVAVAAVTMRKQYRARISSTQVETTPVDESMPGAPVEPSTEPTATAHEPVAMSTTPATNPAKTDDVEPKRNDQASAVATNLTGRWNVINTVQQTSYRPFDNLQIGFDLSISQTGDSFIGRGEKVSENGRTLPLSSRTPIEVKGSVKGNRVEATFFEAGARRKTNGRFIWRIDKTSGALSGSFVTTAARTRGTSSATKS
jgi:hypothetical protein